MGRLCTEPPASALELFRKENPSNVFFSLEEIGRGHFGEVYQATTKDGDMVAVKIMSVTKGYDSEEWSDIHKEILFFQSLEHPNIVGFKGCYRENLKVWLAMEYCVGSAQDVMEALKRGLTEDEIGMICRHVMAGLDYLHGLNKMHRDIKAGNILLTLNGDVKIADFGSASSFAKANSFSGTPFWMAPEMIMAFEAGTYKQSVDIWSMGITAIELADKVPPLFDMNAMSALYHIPQRPPPRLSGDKWTDSFKNFVAECLQKEPENRSSARVLLEGEFLKAERPANSVFELVKCATSVEVVEENRQNLVNTVREIQETLVESAEHEASMSDSELVNNTTKNNESGSLAEKKADEKIVLEENTEGYVDIVESSAASEPSPEPSTPSTPTSSTMSPPSSPLSGKESGKSPQRSPRGSPKPPRSSKKNKEGQLLQQAGKKKGKDLPKSGSSSANASPAGSQTNSPISSPSLLRRNVSKRSKVKRKQKLSGALQEARTQRETQKASSENQVIVSQLKQIQKIRKEQAKTLEQLDSRHEDELEKTTAKFNRELDSLTRIHEKEFDKLLNKFKSELEQCTREETSELRKFNRKEKDKRESEINDHTKEFAAKLRQALVVFRTDSADLNKEERRSRQQEMKEHNESERESSEKSLLIRLDRESDERRKQFNLKRMKVKQNLQVSHLKEELALLDTQSSKLITMKTSKLEVLNRALEKNLEERESMLSSHLAFLEQTELDQAANLRKEAKKAMDKRHYQEQRRQPKELQAEKQRIRKQFSNTLKITKKTSQRQRNTVTDFKKFEEDQNNVIKQLETEYDTNVSTMYKEATETMNKKHEEETSRWENEHDAALAELKRYQQARQTSHEKQLKAAKVRLESDMKEKQDEHNSFIERQRENGKRQENRLLEMGKAHEAQLLSAR
eukprot:m.110206 g.110206  ORF g.110206 m.110206 type:complete len:912 (-) comp14028_c0_seq2:213-2948(-)